MKLVTPMFDSPVLTSPRRATRVSPAAEPCRGKKTASPNSVASDPSSASPSASTSRPVRHSGVVSSDSHWRSMAARASERALRYSFMKGALTDGEGARPALASPGA